MAHRGSDRVQHPRRPHVADHSRAYRHQITAQYFDVTGRAPPPEARATTIHCVEAAAIHRGPERPAFVRVAGHDGNIYLDLGDAEYTVVEIDTDGWRACPCPPVRYWRPDSLRPLPMPVLGGSIATLRRFVNVANDESFALMVAWPERALMPRGPYPVLTLLGEQGSAKSTTEKCLNLLIDPAAVPARRPPRDERDLMITARRNQVVAYDNVSHIPDWLSDAMCALATGAGFGTRTLSEYDEETVFDSAHPLILNGIEDFVTRGDLLERAIPMRHPPIPASQRMMEET